MDEQNETLPLCPLLTQKGDAPVLCLGTDCAWFIAPVKKCALYVMGHKSAFEIQAMQRAK